MSPELEQGALDDAGLDALVTDVSTLATDIVVRCKSVGEHSAPGDLAGAVAALRAGGATAVQVAYSWGGRRWIDTVLRAPAGWRVVRVAG